MGPQRVPKSSTSRTLADVGAELGIGSEAVRRIELRAIAKCRAWCARNGVDVTELLAADPERDPVSVDSAAQDPSWRR